MVQITTCILTDRTLILQLEGDYPQNMLQPPRFSVWFRSKTEDRILPLPVVRMDEGRFTASFTYELWNLFLKEKEFSQFSVTLLDRMEPVAVSFPTDAMPGWIASTEGKTIRFVAKKEGFSRSFRQKFRSFLDANRKEQKKMMVGWAFKLLFRPFQLLSVHPNRITFCSNRRDKLSGNPAFVYEKLAEDPNLDLCVLLKSSGFSLGNLLKFFYYYQTSKVLLVDDYYHYLSYTPKPDTVKVVQLWHACGAYKTFGFSRLGKETSLLQSSPNHRQYDAAIVSSEQVSFCYAEGFGIPTANVYPLGVPRTDAFFDEAYRKQVRRRFYEAHPELRNKKLVLFAPTFRGGGKGDAYYPLNRFPIARILDAVEEDVVFLVKMHPYLKERFDLENSYRGRMLDCSDEAELNDLLFVTDLLITDYSSAVYEAAILKIPMLFYVFDDEEYIASRDFYSRYESWLPGKRVKTVEELIEAICRQDFETEKLEAFRTENLGRTDGHASERTANLIRSMLLSDQLEDKSF